MSTIKVTSDDGLHATVVIDGELVRHAISLTLTASADNVPMFVLEEYTVARGAIRTTTEWHLGSFTLEAEPVE